MPCRAFEEILELRAARVEPVPFGDDPASLAAYPLPALRLAGGTEALRLPVVVLENSSLRAVVAPSLGGRLLALSGAFDAPSEIVPSPGGVRGLVLRHGLRASLDPERDSMARSEHLVHSSEEACAVMSFSLMAGRELCLQTCWTLLDGESELRLEARVSNRSLRACAFRLSSDSGEPLVEGWIAGRDTRAFPFVVRDGRLVGDGFFAPAVPTDISAGAPESLPIQLRGPAHIEAANESGLAGDYRSALRHVDSALATLGDDPLAWWQRAVLSRLAGEADEERHDLTAAHALSPLEPALRAEAFLSIPQQHGREPNPVTAPLAQDPDAMHEAVHLLVEAGLYQEASRLMDEAQRHREFPLLRYVHAWCLMQATRMEVEAAGEVARAAKAPIEPPFPWRRYEVAAVTELAARFPADARLQALASLLKRSGPAN